MLVGQHVRFGPINISDCLGIQQLDRSQMIDSEDLRYSVLIVLLVRR
jgi:hypothetical protein